MWPKYQNRKKQPILWCILQYLEKTKMLMPFCDSQTQIWKIEEAIKESIKILSKFPYQIPLDLAYIELERSM